MTSYNYYKIEINNKEVDGGLFSIIDSSCEPQFLSETINGGINTVPNRKFGSCSITFSTNIGSELQRILDNSELKGSILNVYRCASHMPLENNPDGVELTNRQYWSQKITSTVKIREMNAASDSTDVSKDFIIYGKTISNGWKSIE